MSKPLYYLTYDIQYFGNPKKPSEEKWNISSKAGYLFMNRAAVDEEDQSEILKIFELQKASEKMTYPRHPEYKNFDVERKHKGMIFYQNNDI